MNLSTEDFTPQILSMHYKTILNPIDQDSLAKANKYILTFKNNCNKRFEILFKLFEDSGDLNDKYLSVNLLNQIIKESRKDIMLNKAFYIELKQKMYSYIENIINLNQLNQNENQFKTQILSKIFIIISSLILIGILTNYWEDPIGDILNFDKNDINKLYISANIISNINEEKDNLNFSTREEIAIKEKLLEKSEKLKIFLNDIIVKSNSLPSTFVRLSLSILKFLTSISGLRPLENSHICKVFMGSSDIEVLREFGDILMDMRSRKDEYEEDGESEEANVCEMDNNDCIENNEWNCDNKNICNDIGKKGGFKIEKFEEKIEKEKDGIMEVINSITLYLSKNSSPDSEFLFCFGNIFSTLMLNYIQLLFLKNEISQKCLNLFKYFICNKSKKLSNLFCESLTTMERFINNTYKFSNFNLNEKLEFANFLIEIVNNFKIKSTYSKMENDHEILINGQTLKLNQLDEGDIYEDEDLNEMTTGDFRNNIEDGIFHIFLIFAKIFNENNNSGITFFFENVCANIKDLLINSTNNTIMYITIEKALEIDAVIFVLKSVADCFESLGLDTKPINDFIILIIKSNLIERDKSRFLLSSFLIYLDTVSIYIHYNDEFIELIVNFILENCKKNIIDKIKNLNNINQLCTYVLCTITSAAGEENNRKFNINLWQNIYNFYSNYYDLLEENSLYNITETLASALIVKDDKDNLITSYLSQNEILNYYNKISEITLKHIKKISDIINKKEKEIFDFPDKIAQIPIEIKKNFMVLEKLLKNLLFISDKTLLKLFFMDYFDKIKNDIEICANFCKDNFDVIKAIFIQIEKVSLYFDTEYVVKEYNNLIQFLIRMYSLNSNNFFIVYVIKNVYLKLLNSLLVNTNNNISLISNNEYYIEISNNFFIFLQKLTEKTNEIGNKFQYDFIKILIDFFKDLYKFLVTINRDKLNLIKETIIFFNTNLISIIDDNLYQMIMHAYIVFINNSQSIPILGDTMHIIINGLFNSLEHFNRNSIDLFSKFLTKCFTLDKINTIKIICEIFNSPEYNIIDNKDKEKIISYINIMSNNNKHLNRLFGELKIILAKKGNNDNIRNLRNIINN